MPSLWFWHVNWHYSTICSGCTCLKHVGGCMCLKHVKFVYPRVHVSEGMGFVAKPQRKGSINMLRSGEGQCSDTLSLKRESETYLQWHSSQSSYILCICGCRPGVSGSQSLYGSVSGPTKSKLRNETSSYFNLALLGHYKCRVRVRARFCVCICVSSAHSHTHAQNL